MFQQELDIYKELVNVSDKVSVQKFIVESKGRIIIGPHLKRHFWMVL